VLMSGAQLACVLCVYRRDVLMSGAQLPCVLCVYRRDVVVASVMERFVT